VSERLLTAAELGHLLGFAPGTVVDWAEAGKIPAFKLGGRLRFRESEVLAWLEQRRVVNGSGTAEEVAPVPYQSPDPSRSLTVAPVPNLGGDPDAS
jgi:excisionase family DNA binding protein